MSHETDHGRHRKRFHLKIWHVILGVFAAMLVACILHVAVLSSGANRRIEALRAAGQPTSLAELAVRNKLPMGMENAASFYQSAIGMFVPPPADVNIPFAGKKTVTLARGSGIPESMAEAVAEFLAANEKCLALLHEAAGIENCRYEYDYQKEMPPFTELRGCAQLLKLAAVNHAQKGDVAAAVICIKDLLRLSDLLRDEPRLISYFVQSAYAGLAIRSLERALSLTTFTDSQLRELDDALAVTAGRIDLARALALERCAVIDCIRDPSLVEPSKIGIVIFKLPGVQAQGLIDMLDHLEDCIQAAGLQGPKRETRFKEIEARLSGLSHLHIAAKIMAPPLARTSQLDSRVHAHLDLGRTAVAVERHRLAKGRLPEQLADLVPAYMEQVPIDPFDGQPIRYRRAEPGYVLWSVMEDGQDNGGKDREDVGRGEPYDLCFIVAK